MYRPRALIFIIPVQADKVYENNAEGTVRHLKEGGPDPNPFRHTNRPT